MSAKWASKSLSRPWKAQSVYTIRPKWKWFWTLWTGISTIPTKSNLTLRKPLRYSYWVVWDQSSSRKTRRQYRKSPRRTVRDKQILTQVSRRRSWEPLRKCAPASKKSLTFSRSGMMTIDALNLVNIRNLLETWTRSRTMCSDRWKNLNWRPRSLLMIGSPKCLMKRNKGA